MGTKKQNQKEIPLKGISVSEGIALGSICLYRTELDDIHVHAIPPDQISGELERYYSALNEVNLQLIAKQHRIARVIGSQHAEIYDAYRLILEDPVFQQEIQNKQRSIY